MSIISRLVCSLSVHCTYLSKTKYGCQRMIISIKYVLVDFGKDIRVIDLKFIA